MYLHRWVNLGLLSLSSKIKVILRIGSPLLMNKYLFVDPSTNSEYFNKYRGHRN